MSKDRKLAGDIGVNSTPTLFINGKKQVGGVSIEDLSAAIDAVLPKT